MIDSQNWKEAVYKRNVFIVNGTRNEQISGAF